MVGEIVSPSVEESSAFDNGVSTGGGEIISSENGITSFEGEVTDAGTVSTDGEISSPGDEEIQSNNDISAADYQGFSSAGTDGDTFVDDVTAPGVLVGGSTTGSSSASTSSSDFSSISGSSSGVTSEESSSPEQVDDFDDSIAPLTEALPALAAYGSSADRLSESTSPAEEAAEVNSASVGSEEVQVATVSEETSELSDAPVTAALGSAASAVGSFVDGATEEALVEVVEDPVVTEQVPLLGEEEATAEETPDEEELKAQQEVQPQPSEYLPPPTDAPAPDFDVRAILQQVFQIF